MAAKTATPFRAMVSISTDRRFEFLGTALAYGSVGLRYAHAPILYREEAEMRMTSSACSKSPMAKHRASALHRAAAIVSSVFDVRQEIKVHERCFVAERNRSNGEGILRWIGHHRLAEAKVDVYCLLIENASHARVNASPFFHLLGSLGQGVRLAAPHALNRYLPCRGNLWICVELAESELSTFPSKQTKYTFSRIEMIAKMLNKEVPRPTCQNAKNLAAGKMGGSMTPIQAMQSTECEVSDSLRQWASDTWNLATGGVSVAIEGPTANHQEAGLAFLASIAADGGQTLGRLRKPKIDISELHEVVTKSKAIPVLPAGILSASFKWYDAVDHVERLFDILDDLGRSAIFVGNRRQLHALFQGGQGGQANPLRPAIRALPEIPMQTLIRLALELEGRRFGGISARERPQLEKSVWQAIQGRSEDEMYSILNLTARRICQDRDSPLTDTSSTARFISIAASAKATYASFDHTESMHRSPSMQSGLMQHIRNDGLLEYLQRHLLGQKEALVLFRDHLQAELLARPLHQPIRFCAIGTPGTGKSACAQLLARYCGFSYMNIDAASMPDHNIALCQLFGSGLGYVDSHKRGRLEEAASLSQGVVVEISDLDHARPENRLFLADIFLQALETGRAQSTKGAVFSCANIIFAFTLNLPEGQDETLHHPIGFLRNRDERDRRTRLGGVLRSLFSGAFLSRLGTPIVFSSLDEETACRLARRAAKEAVETAATRLWGASRTILFSKRVGKLLIEDIREDITKYGTRTIMEHARRKAVEAFMLYAKDRPEAPRHILGLGVSKSGRLLVNMLKNAGGGL